MSLSAFSQVASVLQTVLQRHGLAAKILESQLQQRWAQVAGEQIAQHSQPDQIRFRKLYLIVDNSVWLQQMMFLKPTLIEKINTMAGHQSVGDIVLRIGELKGNERHTRERGESASPSVAGSPSASVQQPSVLPEDATGFAGLIKDPDLREKLVALMTTTSVPRMAPAEPQITPKAKKQAPRSGFLSVL
jgi:Dna[CI] antecedent DciA-like protein